jgi:hypothetical protein
MHQMTQDADTVHVRYMVDDVTGPGGQQIVLDDPSGNPIQLFQSAAPQRP